MNRIARSFGVLALVATLASTSLAQQTQFESGHTDIDVGNEDGPLEMNWHDDLPVVGGAEKPADEWYLFQGDAALSTRADAFLDGAAYNFIGAGANDPIYYFPDSTTTDVTLIGLSGEELAASDFRAGRPGVTAGYFSDETRTTNPFLNNTASYVRFSLVGFSGPGDFSLFKQYGSQVVPWMATSDGVGANDYAYVKAGLGHTDYAVAFTEAGIYDITLQASAYDLNGALVTSGATTFRYAIDAQPVPEPATMAALSLGAVALLRRRRKA